MADILLKIAHHQSYSNKNYYAFPGALCVESEKPWAIFLLAHIQEPMCQSRQVRLNAQNRGL